MTAPVRAARRRIETEHTDVIASIDRCADAVEASWDDDRVSDREAVVEPFTTVLESTSVLRSLAEVLIDAVEATGYDLPAAPVAGPPYVVVTSRGPVLRATIDPGRLVVRFDAFAVDRGPDVDYRRLDGVELVVALETGAVE